MRTEVTLNGICDALQRNCGDAYEACREVGVSLIFLEQWCKDDAKVAERVVEAERVGTAGLYSAAVQRAVKGVDEDVYYKGQVVGQKTNYSDSLLTLLLKAKRPEFAKDGEGGGTSVTVNVANIMPRADSYEQWLQMKQVTLAPPTGREKGLEALGRVMTQPAIEAEYVEITTEPSPLANVL